MMEEEKYLDEPELESIEKLVKYKESLSPIVKMEFDFLGDETMVFGMPEIISRWRRFFLWLFFGSKFKRL